MRLGEQDQEYYTRNKQVLQRADEVFNTNQVVGSLQNSISCW
jgi:hypothetical protein